MVFLFAFCAVLFFAPEMGGYFLEIANFQEANPLKTPEHVPPVWYYTPFYSMLRSVTYPLFGIDAKFWGMLVMFGAIAILFVLPWLDKSPVRSMRYKGKYSRVALLVFVVAFLILGVLGTQTVSPAKTLLAQIMTLAYFCYFFAMPWYTKIEKASEPPQRLTGRFITIPQLVGVLFLLTILVAVPLMLTNSAHAAEASKVPLQHVDTDFKDKESLQRGMATYMNYCAGCHELGYARYSRTADDINIPHEVMAANVIFDDTLIGDLIENSMDPENAKAWFGAAPPDLTLIGRVRSPAWLYTYMKSFYEDPSRPLGANNTLYANVGMPNVLVNLQGLVSCDDHGTNDPTRCELTRVEGTGSLDELEFDSVIADLVNFLYYIGEPSRSRRQEIGVWVLAFLALMIVLTTLIGREFGKDYH
jgi:ubiquinol-cytochrome c reductase cytochrome b subunit